MILLIVRRSYCSPPYTVWVTPLLPLQQQQPPPLVILPLDLCIAFAQILYLNVAFKLSSSRSSRRSPRRPRRGCCTVGPVQSDCPPACMSACLSVRLPVSLSARPSAAWRGVFFAFQLLPHFFCVRFRNPWNISRHDLVAFHAHRTQRAAQWRHAQGGGPGKPERGKDMYVCRMWMRVICVCVAGISSYGLHRTGVPQFLPLSLRPTMWSLPAALTLCHNFCSIFTAKVAKTGNLSK